MGKAIDGIVPIFFSLEYLAGEIGYADGKGRERIPFVWGRLHCLRCRIAD